MIALYLKFDNEEQANSFLYDQIPTPFNEELEPTEFNSIPKYKNIDVIGVMYEQQEIVDFENPPVAKEGWHVNVLALPNEDVSSLLDYSVIPENPRRTWAI